MKVPDSPSELVAELLMTGIVLWFGLEVLSRLP